MKRKVTGKLSTFAARLAADIEAMALDHVDDLLDKTRASAVDALRSLVAGGGISVVDEKIVEFTPVVHRDSKPTKRKRSPVEEKNAAPAEVVRPKGACSKCGELGHNARSCGRAPKGNPHGPKPTTDTAAKQRRADIIAKRAGSLPTPSSTFDTGAGF